MSPSRLPLWSLVALLLACGGGSQNPPSASETSVTPPPGAAEPSESLDAAGEAEVRAISSAVEDPSRPESDRARDAGREPIAVLSFLGLRPGMKVVDLMAGTGYYTEILARAVGEDGVVYAQNNAFVVERFADQPLSERLARPGLEKVVRLDRELEDLGIEAGTLDLAMMVLFYHDTYWQETDRAAMNRGIFAALRPGGIYAVIDHHAAPGSGARDVKTLHRVDQELVKAEIRAAGFELVGASDLLAHPEDDRTRNVFDDALRGKTDRFVLKFRKPL